jgi:hypothetical protein
LAAIAARPKLEPAEPPQWIQANLFVELRFHHLSLSDFVLDPVRVKDKGQIEDGIVNRITSLFPEMTQAPHYWLLDTRLNVRLGLNHAARHFVTTGDHVVPQEFRKLLRRLWGDKALDMSFWSCNLPVEILAVANEKEMKALMSHGQQHPCPLPPPALPPPPLPPPPANGAGQDADGSESAASGPDNPGNIQH